MCFTIDQIEQACGLLLLTELNTFVYCCKSCQCEFESGSKLEVHILSEHQDNEEAVFMPENVFVDEFEPIAVENESLNIKIEQFGVNTEVLDESNILEERVNEVRPPTILLMKENLDNDNNRIEKNKSQDEVPFDETTEDHSEENFEYESSDIKMEITIEESKLEYPPESKRSKTVVNPIEKPSKKRNRKINNDDKAKTKISQEPISFYCDMCPDISLKHKRSLLKHMIKRHLTKDMRKCEICNKLPKKSYELHMRAYHSNNGYKCDYCDSTFKRNETKTVHMRTHTGEKPFLCSTCGKAFISYSKCLRHETQVHGSAKRHKCPHCEKTSNARNHLRDHINAIHTKERSFACDICDKSFKTKRVLTLHKGTHDIDKAKIKCRYCETKFTLHSSRRRHENVFHEKVVMLGDKIMNMYNKKHRIKMNMIMNGQEAKE